MVYRERFNLSAQHRDLVDDGAPDALAPAPAVPGGPFALAWRNYIKSVFAKGYMYRLSCKPSVILYIAENKTLGGREDRSYDGEALGRKMVVVIFEDMPGPGCLARRVHRDTVGMQQVLMSIAEVRCPPCGSGQVVNLSCNARGSPLHNQLCDPFSD